MPQVVIVGGGIVGASVAYHLARAGVRDTLLLEQHEIGAGTTWHAAGMVTRMRTSHSMAMLNDHSARLYASLAAETGIDPQWKPVGSLLLARSRDRVTQLRRASELVRLFGIEVDEISLAEAAGRFPGIRTDDLAGAFFLEGDGRVDPLATARALARGAEMSGATLRFGERVTALRRAGGRIVGVETASGPIDAETVVLCAGMWTRQIALDAGIDIPLYPVEHHYVVTGALPGVEDTFPCTRDYDGAIYFRSEGNAIMLGAFQHRTTPWMVDRVPDDFRFQLLGDDWPKFAPAMQEGTHRIPALATAPIARFVNGPESFTPDNAFLLGPAPFCEGLFVVAGLNSAGIATAGGAGWAMADWIVNGRAPMDLWSVDPRRFGASHNTRGFLRERVAEALGLHYQLAWPGREFETGRDLRSMPLHARHQAAGACFGQKFGWERPLWFGEPGERPEATYSFERPSWFDAWRAEHRAARETAALFDLSSYARYEVAGPGALAALQFACTADVDTAVGAVVYTPLLGDHGGFESDLTVVRLGEERFLVITATAQAVHDADWLQQVIRRTGAHATLTDVSTRGAILAVMGPRSRDILQPLVDVDLGNGAFPWGTTQWVEIGRVRALAVRISYVGELGWELHLPAEQAGEVYDALVAAGSAHGMRHAGMVALDSLRLEKGYGAWGADLSPDETPLDAGMGFLVAWEKPGGFVGREALVAARRQPRRKRLVSVRVDDPEPTLWGGEVLYRDGEAVGYLTSGRYGHAVGGAIGMGYAKRAMGVTREWLSTGSWEVGIAGVRYPATVSTRAFHDPERLRLHG